MDLSKLKRKSLLYAGVFLILLFALSLSYFRVLDNYELETLDIRFRLRPQLPTDKNIAIIEIGDDTIDKLGKWPISRRYHATLVDALTKSGVDAIVFDVFFSEESNEEADERLEEAIKRSGKVYLPYVFNIAVKSGTDVPVADRLQEKIINRFKKFAKGTGFINIIPDTDGKFRRVPPLIRYERKLYPHVCFLVAADYFGLKESEMKIKPARYVELGDKLKVPLDSNSTIITNFPGRWKDTFRHYSYIDIIDSYISERFPNLTGRKPIIDLKSLKGSVCFIGVTATATPDAHPSPFDSLYPGVGVHASLFNSFLIHKFIQRASRTINILIVIFLCFITYLISGGARTLLGFLLVFLFILGYAALAVVLFVVWGLWIDIFCPVTTTLFLYLGITFSKYINETQKIEILEKELSIAKKIQESFLPKENPKTPGIDLSAKMLTALQVGGDLYDFTEITDRKLGIMIGDVSGKGVPAALYMAKVVSEFKSYTGEALASQTILKLNERLCREGGSGLFVTLSYLMFNMDTGFLNYSSGGHLPMIVVKEGVPEPHLVDLKDGMPLGLFEGTFSEEKIKFEKGDIFILYTDGVTEAMNPKKEMFGQERLVNLVKNNRSLKSEEMVNLIQDEVRKFEGKQKQHDDITVITVRVV
ncbi:MAG: CHASE2 domain-containing protein [Candidatus Omnitrophica bacterium]|nr:CHASE2 domain-containing protein [Candidatus Omnitrophota bacterium]